MKNKDRLSLAMRDFIDDNIKEHTIDYIEREAEEELFDTIEEYKQELRENATP